MTQRNRNVPAFRSQRPLTPQQLEATRPALAAARDRVTQQRSAEEIRRQALLQQTGQRDAHQSLATLEADRRGTNASPESGDFHAAFGAGKDGQPTRNLTGGWMRTFHGGAADPTPADAPQLRAQGTTGSGVVTPSMRAQGVGTGTSGVANPPPVNNANGEITNDPGGRTRQVQTRPVAMRPTNPGETAATAAQNLDFYKNPTTGGGKLGSTAPVAPAKPATASLDVNSPAIQTMLDHAVGIDERPDHGEGAFYSQFGTGSVRNAKPGEALLPATITADGVSRMSPEDMRADLRKRHPEIWDPTSAANAAYVAAVKAHPQGEVGAYQDVDNILKQANQNVASGAMRANGASPAGAHDDLPTTRGSAVARNLDPETEAFDERMHPTPKPPPTPGKLLDGYAAGVKPAPPVGGTNTITGAATPAPIAKVTPPVAGSAMDQLQQFANIGAGAPNTATPPPPDDEEERKRRLAAGGGGFSDPNSY